MQQPIKEERKEKEERRRKKKEKEEGTAQGLASPDLAGSHRRPTVCLFVYFFFPAVGLAV
jgi:hypothetical protein